MASGHPFPAPCREAFGPGTTPSPSTTAFRADAHPIRRAKARRHSITFGHNT